MAYMLCNQFYVVTIQISRAYAKGENIAPYSVKNLIDLEDKGFVNKISYLYFGRLAMKILNIHIDIF